MMRMVARLEVSMGERTLHVGDAVDLPSGDREIRPPPVTMFDQVLNALDAMPASRRRTGASEARAAAAVCLRWGTYFAFLADEDKPLVPFAHDPKMSRLRNSEMARIHIEATFNLERWLRISHEDPKRYKALVSAAQRLPFPDIPDPGPTGVLQFLEGPMAEMLRRSILETMPDRIEAVKAAPTRYLANALFKMGWRNGPIENLHAGKVVDAAYTDRRFTEEEIDVLMRCAVSGFSAALEASASIAPAWNTPKFIEAVAPLCIGAPSDWSVTESSRTVLLRRIG